MRKMLKMTTRKTHQSAEPRKTPRIRAPEDKTLPLTPASPKPTKTAAKENMVIGLVKVRKNVDEYIPANFLRDLG